MAECRGVAVDETSGTVYFAYGSSLCYVDLQASYPTCTIYSTPFDSFGALTISQGIRTRTTARAHTTHDTHAL